MGAGRPATRPVWLEAFDAHVWQRVAGVSGIAALILGAYGAHVFKPQNLFYMEVWRTANLYHLVHTAALLGAPHTKRPTIAFEHFGVGLTPISYIWQFGGLLTIGIVGFAGACYTAAYMESKRWALPAPFGSMCLMGAWGTLLF